MRLSRAGLDEIREAQETEAVEAEVIRLGQPEHIDAYTWSLIQDTGLLASERLYEILHSDRFLRLRAGDQAKLIKIAQDRAYGVAAAKKEPKRVGLIDVTAQALKDLEKRASLPEYRKSKVIDDAEEI